ncbi:V-type proton ATPase subunit H-like protein [Elsinoe australis]|uniref:V-type proton ATPase subunit H-like protein n=1 Tax=Elsinoe australis TaxID=40998 RepID=A0A4U7B1Q0_9PEZI|nr:V-type proton ATPase subunit H-like protein [Elsinoe australis]
MANGWSIVIGLICIVAFSAVSWFGSPKGENQTVWRSSLILSAFFCYLMWLITFLAQWHPLIVPERSDLRPEFWKVEPPK